MKNPGTLQLTTPSEREIQMTRVFDAPRKLVFEAHSRPELLQRWLLGPDGWSMPVCEVDFRVGGAYRYVWRRESRGDGSAGKGECATEMGMGGIYREIVAPVRIVATETFDQAWYPGSALCTLVLLEAAGKTTLQQTMLYESRAARDSVLESGMESGVAASYDRLAKILTT